MKFANKLDIFVVNQVLFKLSYNMTIRIKYYIINNISIISVSCILLVNFVQYCKSSILQFLLFKSVNTLIC